MGKHWIEQLRNRFSGREIAPPDGLWEGIEAALRDKGVAGFAGSEPRRGAKTVAMRRRRAVAVAACVVLLAGSGWLVFGPDADRETPPEGRNAVPRNGDGDGVASAGGESDVPSAAGPWSPLRSMGRRIAATLSMAEEQVTDVISSVDSIETSATVMADAKERGRESVPGSGRSIVVKRRQTQPADVYRPAVGEGVAAGPGSDRHVGFALAVYGGGLTPFGNSQGSMNPALVPYSVQNSPVVNSGVAMLTASAGVLKNMSDAAGEVSVKHRQPVKIGLSARFGVARRVSLETGVNYSYHSADIASGDDESGYKAGQKLHYIGIPLSVSYDIWHTDRLEVYGSAGGGVEFCVSGSTHTDYISGNRVVSSATADVRDDRPQWSVNASAGIQYNFTDHVGVYAEPGVSYYFDNGSDVTTIYKDKPLNFNLNVGLRFTIK